MSSPILNLISSSKFALTWRKSSVLFAKLWVPNQSDGLSRDCLAARVPTRRGHSHGGRLHFGKHVNDAVVDLLACCLRSPSTPTLFASAGGLRVSPFPLRSSVGMLTVTRFALIFLATGYSFVSPFLIFVQHCAQRPRFLRLPLGHIDAQTPLRTLAPVLGRLQQAPEALPVEREHQHALVGRGSEQSARLLREFNHRHVGVVRPLQTPAKLHQRRSFPKRARSPQRRRRRSFWR
mmetsp:Transcript_27652/g.46864  ORF Transcript_27652/g.46864 Transcript_27652/m.46864 type:complete len:235 (+) Transcript_27652:409-1113(+)